jgi:hypothetical protein
MITVPLWAIALAATLTVTLAAAWVISRLRCVRVAGDYFAAYDALAAHVAGDPSDLDPHAREMYDRAVYFHAMEVAAGPDVWTLPDAEFIPLRDRTLNEMGMSW